MKKGSEKFSMQGLFRVPKVPKMDVTMILKFIAIVFLIVSLQSSSIGQTETYTVTLAPFSTEKFDEFAPVFYKEGIVFCSNQNQNLILNYTNSQNKGQIKIYFIAQTDKINLETVRLLSKDLSTKLNDGPVTFSKSGDTIYYSRNLEVEGKLAILSSARNKLGIFSAVNLENQWTKVREFRINSEWYNITTPCLSRDGKRLYFTSDKPGGQGGSDIYYSERRGEYWNDPVNLGPVINTAGNESYPFINNAGELFFSSDGYSGLGGKDIYFSRFSDTAWISPVHLDAPINSRYDDFGFISDNLLSSGYFSSNRNGSFDIFRFKTNFPQVFYTNIQKQNQYCFRFSDDNSGSIVIDSIVFQYNWHFGDGESASGAVVKHCYDGAGNYDVRLEIIEKSTGKLFFTKLAYNLDLKDFKQPYINSPDVVAKGNNLELDALKSYLPGYQILSYSWDFGDVTRLAGEKVQHSYKETGEYLVNLGLSIKSDSTGTIQKTGVSKKIIVMTDQQEVTASMAKNALGETKLTDIKYYQNAKITTLFSAESDLKKDAVFVVELLSSKNKIGVLGSTFRNVPKKYTIKELFNEADGQYSYIADQQMSLLATYPAYREMLVLGFKDVQIKVLVLNDADEKELHNLIKIYGAFADSYFDSSNRLTSNAYIMLDQIVKLMNKYPTLILEVDVHSDNIGTEENSLTLSQKRAEILSAYLVNKNINSKRIVAKGFGGSKPIATNYLEKDRKLNRRIDFVIINH